MNLEIEDVEQFFRIHRTLMWFLNRRLKVIPGKLATPEAYAARSPEDRIKVHDVLIAHPDLVDAFADENPSGLDEDDLTIVRSWKHLVGGKFYAFRQLQHDMIFLTADEPTVAYGVLALFDPFDLIVGPYLPRLVETTLLPFKGRIVYDGVMSSFNVSFGPGIRRRLNEDYKAFKAYPGVIRSLPPAAVDRPPAKTKAKKKGAGKAAKTQVSATPGAPAVPSASRPAHDRIVALTDEFCSEHLDDEYAAMSRTLAGVLARKRPSPLVRGKPESWACGIVRALGFVNFLGDPSQPHHMKMTDIDKGFGVSEATGAAKSMAIRDALRMTRFDPEWALPSLLDRNPLIWIFEVNGLPMDIRHCPRDAQVVAFENGLIPFIPADRAGD